MVESTISNRHNIKVTGILMDMIFLFVSIYDRENELQPVMLEIKLDQASKTGFPDLGRRMTHRSVSQACLCDFEFVKLCSITR
jgi:hypothetical protein